MAAQLGLEPMCRKIDNFKIIQNEITRYSVEKRITMNYNLDNLTKPETKDYILAKLNGVKCNTDVFDDTALEAIANASNGVLGADVTSFSLNILKNTLIFNIK